MTSIALFEAKNRLSELLDRVEAGEEFMITRRGRIVARLASPDRRNPSSAAQSAVDRLRDSRQGVSLRGLKARDLIREGRR